MKQIVLSVFDSAVGQYLTPFFQRSKAEALRSFTSACNQQDHDFNKFSSDYTLFALGEFDVDTAQFTQYPAPERLAVAIEVIERASPTTPELFVAEDAVN